MGKTQPSDLRWWSRKKIQAGDLYYCPWDYGYLNLVVEVSADPVDVFCLAADCAGSDLHRNVTGGLTADHLLNNCSLLSGAEDTEE